ncbi:dopamine receptor 1-like [Babylonia areolata]|uniref:dopamine receptor 1-like n=1 Tax=Babylonia areolata TaxID=304850 RepID=UPI003FD1B349
MTFAALNDFRGRWDFGATFCLIWVCCDIMACTASILSLLLICVDRYLQISSPMTTESKGARTSSFTVKTSGFKATLTLGIIVGVFILCWLPFFIVNPIFAKCAACIPDVLFKAFTWLGYVNSCANPFIYTLSNKEFRTAFRNTLLKKIDDSLASRNGF